MANVGNARGKFVYPFLVENVAAFNERCERVSAAEINFDDATHRIWEGCCVLEQDLLPHVAKHIKSGEDQHRSNVGIWKITGEVLQSTNYGLGSGRNSGGLTYGLLYPHGEIQFYIEGIDLYLFRTGMGGLVLDVVPVLPDQNVDLWFDFLSYFRYFGGNRDVSISCMRSVGFDWEKNEKIIKPFFPNIAKQERPMEAGKGFLSDIIDGILESVKLECEGEDWKRDVFIPNQLLPFSMLFLKDTKPVEFPLKIYQYRKMLHSHQVLIPPLIELSLDHRGLFQYTEIQWFVFSLDGGGFISFNHPKSYFFEKELPIHLMDQYFLAFMLTVHQRFVLTFLADKVVDVWLTVGQKDEDEFGMFEKLQEIFKAFASLGNYIQVMQRDNLHQVYQQWQSEFQIDRLYHSVNQEIEHISNFLQSRQEEMMRQIEKAQNLQTKRLERQINVITLLIGVPAILFSFFEMLYSQGVKIAVVALLGGFTIGGMILWLVSRKKKNK